MASEALIVPATEAHAELLAQQMRQADRDECAAAGKSPREVLDDSLSGAVLAMTLLIDGEVAAMFGVHELELASGRAGVLWLLTGELVDQHRLLFARTCKRLVTHLLEEYDVLGNMIDARYLAAQRLVVVLGGKLFPAVPYPRTGSPFVPFQFRRH